VNVPWSFVQLHCNLRFNKAYIRNKGLKNRLRDSLFWNNDLSLRKCMLCNSKDIEDIFHVMLICPHYKSVRKKYLTSNIYASPSRENFVACFQNHTEDTMKQNYYFWCDTIRIREFYIQEINHVNNP